MAIASLEPYSNLLDKKAMQEILTGNVVPFITKSLHKTGEVIKKAQKKIEDKFYKVRSNFKTLRDDQDEIYTAIMNKLATDDLKQTVDYEETKVFLRTQFVNQFCNALRSVSLNAYKGTIIVNTIGVLGCKP